MHTSSTNLVAAISTSSTGTITSILHKRDLSTQQLPCPRNINTLHPRTRPLREKGCLCPSPTKPKTTTPLLTRFDSRVTLTGPSLYSNYTTKGISAQLILFCIWRNRHRCPAHTPVGTSNTPCRCLCTQAAPILHSYINKLYRHYNKHSTQTRSVHTAIAMPKEYQYFTS